MRERPLQGAPLPARRELAAGALALLLMSACSSEESAPGTAGGATSLPTGGASGAATSGGSGGSTANTGGAPSQGGKAGAVTGGAANTGGGSAGTASGGASGSGGATGGAGGAQTGGSAGAANGGASSGGSAGADGGGGGPVGGGGGGGAAATSYRNPVIPGFHPDPSVCRVGDDFYLVTSTFEYFPGLPIFHSRDLVHWRQIGHALTRASQLPLADAASSGGIYAPTLRYDDGTFYIVTTNISDDGNFLVTASDPAGPWSEPIWIDDPGGGIDPSLFFDDDGTVYYTRHGEGEQGGIFQTEIDVSSGALVGQPVEIWSGTGGIWPEGPHLYKIDGSYYLMIAEGGTSYDHRETIARSSSPSGPFEAFSANPILTHSDLDGEPIQATGHADLVELASGAWWLLFLGIRPWDGAHHHLGRETFLAPVTWNEMGWPVVNGDEPIALEMSSAGLPPLVPAEPAPVRDDFTDAALGFAWNFVRNPSAESWSLSARSGFLRLQGNAVSLDDVGSPAFVGRRQEHLRARASTLLEFVPNADGQEAGLALRANETNHYELAVTQVGGTRRVRLRTTIDGAANTVAEPELTADSVTLRVEAYDDHYEFFYEAAGANAVSLGNAPTTPLSSEEAGGFTGVYFGMYASSSGGSMPAADFDWFDYEPLAE